MRATSLPPRPGRPCCRRFRRRTPRSRPPAPLPPPPAAVAAPAPALPALTSPAAVPPYAAGPANAPLSSVGGHSTTGEAPVVASPIAALPDGTAALLQVHDTQLSPALPFAMVPGATAGSWGTAVPQSLMTVRTMSRDAGSAIA